MSGEEQKKIDRDTQLFVRDACLAEDAQKIRDFLLQRSPELGEKISALSDEDIKKLAIVHKAQNIYYGEDFYSARNKLRIERLEERAKEWTDDLKAAHAKDDSFPLCNDCTHFRTAPAGEESPCMHLGSMPQDVACASWSAIKN